MEKCWKKKGQENAIFWQNEAIETSRNNVLRVEKGVQANRNVSYQLFQALLKHYHGQNQNKGPSEARYQMMKQEKEKKGQSEKEK